MPKPNDQHIIRLTKDTVPGTVFWVVNLTFEDGEPVLTVTKDCVISVKHDFLDYYFIHCESGRVRESRHTESIFANQQHANQFAAEAASYMKEGRE